jgi:hypothetical protein
MFSFRELARSTKQIKLADRSFPNQIKTKLTVDVPGTNGRAPPDYAVSQRRVVALMVTSCLLDGERDRSTMTMIAYNYPWSLQHEVADTHAKGFIFRSIRHNHDI